MLLDEDLLPFAARRPFARLPDSLRAELLDPEARSVMRDWARDHDHSGLEAALEPRAFYFHACTVLVERYDPLQDIWTTKVRWDASRESILLVQEGSYDDRDEEEDRVAWIDLRTGPALDRLGVPLWRLGLEESGRDAILVGPSPDLPRPGGWQRITGYVPRRGRW
ncbi:MAG: hypothetical protein AAF602_07675 [Myxococcota bacterium]